jgi:short-subunit dehydrogenase
MPGRTILISGATDGIGLALARHYQQQGAQLILLGRRAPAALDPALLSVAHYCRVDLAQPYCGALVADFLRAQHLPRLDLLIHNAGLGAFGPPATQDAAQISALVAVNLRAPLALTHALLPWLPPQQGQIVFISSVAAALPCPDYAVYCATKAALNGFARALRVELDGTLTVQVIHPGATRTSMHAKSGVPAGRLRVERFPPAERVAAQIAQAIERRTPEATIGASNRLLRLLGRNLGGAIEQAMRRRAS